MEKKAIDDRLAPVLLPLLEKLGYAVVELKSRATRDALQVHLVIYRAAGVDLQACTEVYKAVLPRLEVSENRRDIHLEVSSPGLFRTLKSASEFSVFEGRGIKVLTDKSAEWVGGTIVRANESSLVVGRSGKETELAFRNILKAELDSTQEVGN